MKKVLILVVALVATNAFASRARVSALGNSPHLVDTQTVYSNPADMMMMADYVNFETGSTAGGAQNANTEGMITRSMGDAKMGLALGHQSENASAWTGAVPGLRSVLNTALFSSADRTGQQNPIEFSYGVKNSDMAWAATLVYSNYNDKSALEEKESSMGIRAGMRMGAWDAKLGLGLVNTYQNATDGKFQGTMGLSGGAGYMMDNMYVFGDVVMAGYKTETAASVETSKFNRTKFTVGALSVHKNEGNQFFYGASLVNQTDKNETTPTGASDVKTTIMNLPIWMGFEVEANSWLTMRASVTQKTLIDSKKVENNVTSTASTDTAPGANSTAASVGAGLKWGKLMVDGSFTSLTSTGTANQQLDGTQLLSQVGMTYNF